MTELEDNIENIVMLLRNGAVLCGDHHITRAQREKCIEQAYYEMCTILVPLLLKFRVIRTSIRLENLCDVGAMLQKVPICRPVCHIEHGITEK